ncbi:SDR family NAD(P)-dependent oxidoreductase [Pseudonocardia spinosispora]|uniref:SDR family NAD(P)-dependent oxidoreductase n=1 Tax=Pseudonocardia spinosispora TaxID=103441 RepID=UPI0004291F96|nr:SDR family NAD(P)-dependent oxidoreductase [Pseudonocardia spinosispora]
MVHPSRRIALVTGANRGIGFEIAGQLADLGMTVLLAARGGPAGRHAVERLRLRNGSRAVEPVTLDVTDPTTVRAAAATVADRHSRLDVLVNNAAMPEPAVPGRAYHPPSSCDLDTLRALFETNLFGVVTVTNAFLPLLRRSDGGRIVNLSSGLASLSAMSAEEGPFSSIPPNGAYIPAKTALNSLTVQYSRELREAGILVNAADPGPCATGLNPTGPRSAARGALVAVRLATLGPDGPSGGFFSDQGQVAW